MKLFLNNLLSVLLFLSFLTSCNNHKSKNNDMESNATSIDKQTNVEKGLQEANDSLYAALNDMFNGEFESINKVWSHSDKVTYMGPFGERLTGWDAVGEAFKEYAAMKMGGKISPKDTHIFAGTDMGYAICVEEGINVNKEGLPFTVSHRATNVFHFENGQWKLVHHQTDMSSQLVKSFKP